MTLIEKVQYSTRTVEGRHVDSTSRIRSNGRYGERGGEAEEGDRVETEKRAYVQQAQDEQKHRIT